MPKPIRSILLYKNRPSNGAITLRKASPLLRLLRPGFNKRLLQNAIIINWGTTDGVLEGVRNVLNDHRNVAVAINKIAALKALREKNVNVPPFWTKKEEVPKPTAESIVFARVNIRGCGGDGIKVIRGAEQLPDAPLYVKYIRKNSEFRLHVFQGQVIFTQQKKAKAGVDRTADQNLIRCHNNGYVFAENEVDFGNQEQALKASALAAVAALGLDFGAVDLITGKDNKVYVLEVNTAPGIESTALADAYSTALKNL